MFGLISRFIMVSAAVSINVILVLGVWQRDGRRLVFIQLHAVQVACWLVAMQFSSPSVISTFCVFQSTAFILSTAVSISPVSISSSVSFMEEMSLSWSQSVFELLP